MEGESCVEAKKDINIRGGRGIDGKGKCVMKDRSRSSSFDELNLSSSQDQSIFNCYSIYKNQAEEIGEASSNETTVEEIEASKLVSDDSSNIIHTSNGPEVEAVFYLNKSSARDSSGEFTGRESRHNNIRRRLWDALLRRSSSLAAITNDGFDSLGSDNSRRQCNWNMGQSRDSLKESRHRFMVWDFHRRTEEIVEGSSRPYRPCPLQCHSDGQCNCETYAVEEGTDTRTLLSRIIIFVQILYEVLKIFFREFSIFSSLASLSIGQLPAPDSIVNSFPVHIHKKPLEEDQDDGQCYICFSDYIDGDELRTLPCSHQFHVDCVDKWLKEVHRECPLCRDNVCESYLDFE